MNSNFTIQFLKRDNDIVVTTMPLSQCVTLLRVAWFGYRNQCPERKTISRFRFLSHARDNVVSRTLTRSQDS